MPQIPTSISSVVAFTMTMSDDNAHRIVEFDCPFYDLNIHCYTEDANYGNMHTTDGEILTGDVAFFRNGNLKDFLFKNKSAGSNCKIVCVATVPTKFMEQVLKGGL